jgi:hypothetical protein
MIGRVSRVLAGHAQPSPDRLCSRAAVAIRFDAAAHEHTNIGAVCHEFYADAAARLLKRVRNMAGKCRNFAVSGPVRRCN